MSLDPTVTAVALVWAGILVVVGSLRLLRSRDLVTAAAVLSFLGTLLVIFLAIVSFRSDTPYYLDAALAVALLAYIGTIATLRYYRSGSPF